MHYVDRISRARHTLGAILISGMAMAHFAAPARAGDTADQGTAAATKAPSRAPTRGVDGLISHLHEAFKVTPAQEPLFQKLADVMRQDADAMSALAKKRAEASQTTTAVDDLKSYAQISEAHAEGAKNMIPAFQALYESMSDAQKKAADQEFREHYATHHRRQR